MSEKAGIAYDGKWEVHLNLLGKHETISKKQFRNKKCWHF